MATRRRNDSALRLLSYARVSDTRGREGPSFIGESDQFARTHSYAKTYGHKILEDGSDLDVSGGKMSRPVFDRYLKMIANNEADGMIVAKLDRFARSLKGALSAVEQIEESGGVLISVAEQIDTSTPAGKFLRSILFAVDEWNGSVIGDKWHAARTSSVGRGIHDAPYVPPGYERTEKTNDPKTDRRLRVHRVHAPTIKKAYKMARDGASYAKIADYLNERKLPVTSIKNGERETYWTGSKVPRLLANRAYLGEARSGEGIEPNREAHTPLVDTTTWLLAQRANRPATPRLRTPNRDAKAPPSILSNIIYCAGCSMAMKPQGEGKSSPPIYRCPNTKKSGRCVASSTITKERVEFHVLLEFTALMDAFLEYSAGVGGPEFARNVETEYITSFLGLHFGVGDLDDDVRGALLAEAHELERSYRDQLTNTKLRKEIGDADHDVLIGSLHREWREKLAEAEKIAPLKDPPNVTDAVASLRELVLLLIAEGKNEELRDLLAPLIRVVFVRPAMSRARDLPVSDRVKIVWCYDDEEIELPTRGRRFEPREYVW